MRNEKNLLVCPPGWELISSERLREAYVRRTLSSGLRLCVFPKKTKMTHAVFSTEYGSFDNGFCPSGEGKILSVPDGIAHFLEHKLFDNEDGTDSFETFSSLGADANAYTGNTRTAYLFNCSDHFEEALTELVRFVTHPYFTEASVKKEQGIIAEEIRMYRDNPWERGYQNLLRGMFVRHPIRREICGSEKSIAGITPALLYECHKAFYNPANMVLSVCGDVDPERVLAICEENLPGDFEPFSVRRVPVDEPDHVRQARIEEVRDVSEPIFNIGIKDPAYPAGDPEKRNFRTLAADLLDEILFSPSGDFFRELFESGLVKPNFSAGYNQNRDLAFHCLYGESKDPDEVLRRIREKIRDAAERGLDAEDFERCRRVAFADEIRGFDSSEEIAGNLLCDAMGGMKLFGAADLLAEMKKEDVEALLPDLLPEERYCLSVILPKDGKNAKDAPADGD